MKDFIISGEELFIHFREGTIVYPQLKQILFQTSTSHKTSSLVVFNHSQKERDVSSTKARKTKQSVQTVTFLLVFIWWEPQLLCCSGASDSGWQEWLWQGKHRMSMYPFPYVSLNQWACCKDLWYHIRVSQATFILPRKKLHSSTVLGLNPGRYLTPLPDETGNIQASVDSRRNFSSDLKYWVSPSLFFPYTMAACTTCYCFSKTWSRSSLTEENLKYLIPI